MDAKIKIKRYRFGVHHYLEISDNGVWCRFEDVEQILEDNQNLFDVNQRLREEIGLLKSDTKNLEYEAMNDHENIASMKRLLSYSGQETARLEAENKALKANIKDLECSAVVDYEELDRARKSISELENEVERLKKSAARWNEFCYDMVSETQRKFFESHTPEEIEEIRSKVAKLNKTNPMDEDFESRGI